MSTSPEKKSSASAEKRLAIEAKFREILEILKFDLTAPSRAETPRRMAEIFLEKIFGGVDPHLFPEITPLDEPSSSGTLMIEKEISFMSFCEHHFVPIIGVATIGYVVNKKLLGLYSIHKVVHYFAARPQLQERLASEIAQALKTLLECEDVAVSLSTMQVCTLLKDVSNHSQSITHHFNGRFQTDINLVQSFLISSGN